MGRGTQLVLDVDGCCRHFNYRYTYLDYARCHLCYSKPINTYDAFSGAQIRHARGASASFRPCCCKHAGPCCQHAITALKYCLTVLGTQQGSYRQCQQQVKSSHKGSQQKSVGLRHCCVHLKRKTPRLFLIINDKLPNAHMYTSKSVIVKHCSR